MRIYYSGQVPLLCVWIYMWSITGLYMPMPLCAWVHPVTAGVQHPYLVTPSSDPHLMCFQIVPWYNLGLALRAGCPNLLTTGTTSCSQSRKPKLHTKRLSQIDEPCQTFSDHLLPLQVLIWALFLCHQDCQQSLTYSTLQQYWLYDFLWQFKPAYQWKFARCLVQLMNYPK